MRVHSEGPIRAARLDPVNAAVTDTYEFNGVVDIDLHPEPEGREFCGPVSCPEEIEFTMEADVGWDALAVLRGRATTGCDCW